MGSLSCVPEMREEVRQELSDLRLPIQQQLALENQIMIEIQKEISVDDGKMLYKLQMLKHNDNKKSD
jgi:hypothetical protein